MGYQSASENIRALVHPDDFAVLDHAWNNLMANDTPFGRMVTSAGAFRALPPRVMAMMLSVSAASPSTLPNARPRKERQTLLSREVDNRAKNALALVQSIVRLTRRADPADYTQTIEGRINALSRVHTVLSQSRWQGADLGGLLREELAPFRSSEDDRITMQGPELSLDPACAQTLALALHELTTNAAKYGALSNPASRLSVHWTISSDTLKLE